jgi:myo-inositol-1-phosphate synthase
MAKTTEVPIVQVNSPDVKYTEDAITANYTYRTTQTKQVGAELVVEPMKIKYRFRTERKVPRFGVMIVGLGGNNGSTVVGGVTANRENITWNTKEGIKTPNYYGSMLLSSTLRVGTDAKGQDIYTPMNSVLPMVHPNNIVFGGWDINGADLAEAMARAKVFDYDLQVCSTCAKLLFPLLTTFFRDNLSPT